MRKPLALLACVALASCAGAPPPVTVDKPPPPPPTPPPPPARWVRSGGATAIGPQTAKGTLVLVGGRRALVSADGAVEVEKFPTREPLDQLVAIPVGGATVIVGRGDHEIVRFDDPLGAPAPIARSEAMIARIGAGPGVVAVWSSGGGHPPRFLDVQTGQEKPLAGLPEPPLAALTFVDAKRGAGVFELAGLAVTADGGTTWRPVAAHKPRDAFGVKGVRARGEALRAYLYEDGPDALVEVDQAKLGTFEPTSAPQQPLLRWIHATSRDPLEAVAMGGVELPGGAALIGSHGMLARVDVKTGALSELHTIAEGRSSTCYTARAATTAWVACGLPDDDDHFDPFGVMRVPLAEGKIAPDKPSLVRNTEAELRVSPSGGALLMGSCNPEEGDGVCVRQPDGKWRTHSDVQGMDIRGAGALADGRVVFLRGLSEDDAAPEEEPGAAPPDEAQGPVKRLHIATFTPEGKEKPLAVVPFPSPDVNTGNYLRAQSPLEEDSDHSLHMVLAGEDAAFVVNLPSGRDTATVQRIPDAVEARIRGGRGVAIGNEKLQISLDSGAGWSEVPTPPDAQDAVRYTAVSGDPDALRVSEMGLRLGSFLRLGWGAPEPLPALPEQGPMATLARPHAAPSGPEWGLTCTGAGAGTGLPVLQGSSETRALLGFKTKPNDKRSVSTWTGHSDGHDPVALLEEEATDKRDAPPPGWTFRWHDPREIGAKARSANVKPPADARKGSELRLASAEGGRALFAVRSGGKLHVVRIKPAGGAEIAVIPNDLAPSQQVVFGADKGEPIAWMRDNLVVVWLAGEKPRAIAELGNLSRGVRVLGTPTAAGVPLLASADEWALTRTLPIPAMAKGEAKPPPPAPPALDGWARVAPLRRALGTLAACGAKAKGARFLLDRSALRTEIDGVPANGSSVHYGVRITGTEACVDAVYATLMKSRTSTPKPTTPAKGAPAKPAKAAPAGATWVRADLIANKAEGGERGAPPAGDTRRMKCALKKP